MNYSQPTQYLIEFLYHFSGLVLSHIHVTGFPYGKRKGHSTTSITQSYHTRLNANLKKYNNWLEKYLNIKAKKGKIKK